MHLQKGYSEGPHPYA